MENTSLADKLTNTLVGATFGILETASLTLAAGYQHAHSPYNSAPGFIHTATMLETFKAYGPVTIALCIATGLAIDGALAWYERRRTPQSPAASERAHTIQ